MKDSSLKLRNEVRSDTSFETLTGVEPAVRYPRNPSTGC